MAGPWEKYQAADAAAPTAPSPGANAGPWTKYGSAPTVNAANPPITASVIEQSPLDPQQKWAEKQERGFGKPGFGEGVPQAAYDLGGKTTDIATKIGLPPKVAAGAGTIANVGAQALPAIFGGAKGLGSARVPSIPKPPGMDMTLAQKATEHGIPLRPDMLSKNKFLRMAGEASEQVPLSGGKGEARQVAFNKAIAKTLGAEGDKITPDVYEKAMNKYGKMIGDISGKNPVPFDAKLKSALESHAANAANVETADVAKAINYYVKEIVDQGTAKGQIDGIALRKIRTKLTGQMRRTTNGDLKHALSELDEDLLDSIQGQLSPDELKSFNQARRYYRNGKIIEPLVAKGTGDISPQALMGRVTSDASGKAAMARGKSGDIGDLARIGQRFLKEPASSGTAERKAVYSGLLGGGALAEPMTAASIYGGANIYNRLSPWLARKMIPPPP